MSEKFNYHVGVDPGWKNLGLSVVEEEVLTGELKLIHSQVMDPSSFSSISGFIEGMHAVINPLIHKVDSVTIERYVAYAGVSTSESENICMVIGALSYYFAGYTSWKVEPLLLRAIDWKTALVKALFKKKKFDNPSDKLDKKFSIAAAIACMDHVVSFKTDHEADSTCLAAYQCLLRKRK